jgi:hypothetical protein
MLAHAEPSTKQIRLRVDDRLLAAGVWRAQHRSSAGRTETNGWPSRSGLPKRCSVGACFASPTASSTNSSDASPGSTDVRAGFIWRSRCQGVALIGHRLWWGDRRVGVVLGCRGDAAASVFATCGQPHMRGLSQDLCSSHGPPSEIERGPLVGGLLTSQSRTDLCASTEAAAPSRQPRTVVGFSSRVRPPRWRAPSRSRRARGRPRSRRSRCVCRERA